MLQSLWWSRSPTWSRSRSWRWFHRSCGKQQTAFERSKQRVIDPASAHFGIQNAFWNKHRHIQTHSSIQSAFTSARGYFANPKPALRSFTPPIVFGRTVGQRKTSETPFTHMSKIQSTCPSFKAPIAGLASQKWTSQFSRDRAGDHWKVTTSFPLDLSWGNPFNPIPPKRFKGRPL